MFGEGKKKGEEKGETFLEQKNREGKGAKIFKKKTKKQYDSLERLKKSDGLKKHETKFIFNSLVTREQLDGR